MSGLEVVKLLGLLSVVTFIGSLIAVPWLIGRMESDYFLVHWHQVEDRHRRHPLMALAVLVLRNGFGLALVVAGLAMLVLPGQGLLTLIIGICLMDFPGKRHLLNRLSRMPQVQRGLNWIRRRRGKDEFIFPEQGV